jgi:hypothetical protein
MTADSDLHVKVQDGNIVVTLPCTHYTGLITSLQSRRSFWQGVSPARTIHTLA